MTGKGKNSIISPTLAKALAEKRNVETERGLKRDHVEFDR